MQLKAGGEIESLKEDREIIDRSFEIKDYYPQDKTFWQECYERFKNMKK